MNILNNKKEDDKWSKKNNNEYNKFYSETISSYGSCRNFVNDENDLSNPGLLQEKALGADDIYENEKEYEQCEIGEDSADEPDYEALIQEGIESGMKKVEKLFSSGAYMESVEELNILLKIIPDDPDFLFKKGFALNKIGKYKEALDVLDELLKIDPKHKNALDLKISLVNK